MSKPAASVEPLYLQVKRHILNNIESGKWAASARVPSESEIVKSAA
jgi:DNA-binding GntR family transcriptional regulator